MDIDMMGFAPQGWQCPICKRVYSPTTPMCWYCGDTTGKITMASTTTVIPKKKTDREIWEEAVDHILNDEKSQTIRDARKKLMMDVFDKSILVVDEMDEDTYNSLPKDGTIFVDRKEI